MKIIVCLWITIFILWNVSFNLARECEEVLNMTNSLRGTKPYDALPATNQIYDWSEKHTCEFAKNDHGVRVPSLTATLSAGKYGPLLLQDFNFQSHLSNFLNERTPERVVHAKGAGALGHFVTTNSMAQYTKATVFNEAGKRTPVVVRFSTVVGNEGSADTVVDQRGFAVKFKTTDGNYDLMSLNVHIFPIRDAILFPAVSRSRARNPSTHLPDPDMLWDYASLRPEGTFNLLQVNSDLGFFKNFRHMEGHSINTFKWTGGSGTNGEPVFVKYHWFPNIKKEILSPETYQELAGSDPDYMIRDLYNSIAQKVYPAWTLKVQLLTLAESIKYRSIVFDATRILPVKDFPMTTVGVLVLNQNPVDYFNQVEQVAFSPVNLIPGIELSQDRLLEGRSFAYFHTQIHRIGINANQLPINRPKHGVKESTYRKNGKMNIYGDGDGGPTYYPNSFNGPVVDPKTTDLPFQVEESVVDRYDVGFEDNHSQANAYWHDVMSPGERNRTVHSISISLALASPAIQEASFLKIWDPVNVELSSMLRVAVAKVTAAAAGKAANQY